MTLAICAITPGGADLARRLGSLFPAAEVWLPESFRAVDGVHYSASGMADLLPRLFHRCDGLICIMATGIVVRTLAPHLRGKDSDPAIVVVDETGRFAISLLSGHLGGANDLAREIAAAIGALPVITTATDVNGLCAWDEAARHAGLAIEPIAHLRTLNSLLLTGGRIALVDCDRLIANRYTETPGVFFYPDMASANEAGAAGIVLVTDRLIHGFHTQRNLLLLRPRHLVIGIGCNRHTSSDEISAAVNQTLQEAELSSLAIGRIATIEEKGDEEGLLAFAEQLRLPLITFSSRKLNSVTAPSPPSEHALAAVGARGVCEPAALLAADGGPLLIPKQKHGQVTVAVARLTHYQPQQKIGRE